MIEEQEKILEQMSKVRYDSADLILGESIMDFKLEVDKCNVNELSNMKSALGMIKGEMNAKASDVMRSRFLNPSMSESDYSTFCSFLVSIGSIIRNCDDKLDVLEHALYAIMPDCFKQDTVNVEAKEIKS